MIWKQIRLFFILPYKGLLWPWIKIPEKLVCVMDNICLKNKYSSLKIDSISVIKLTALAKQRGIKGYYKLRKAQLIKKLESHPDVNEHVLIPG